MFRPSVLYNVPAPPVRYSKYCGVETSKSSMQLIMQVQTPNPPRYKISQYRIFLQISLRASGTLNIQTQCQSFPHHLTYHIHRSATLVIQKKPTVQIQWYPFVPMRRHTTSSVHGSIGLVDRLGASIYQLSIIQYNR